MGGEGEGKGAGSRECTSFPAGLTERPLIAHHRKQSECNERGTTLGCISWLHAKWEGGEEAAGARRRQEAGGRRCLFDRSMFVVKINKRTFHFNPFYVAVDFAIKQLNLLTANL